MDIKKIKSFQIFLDSGCNYKKTAAECAVTVPGLRKQLCSLEAELGAKLFEVEGKTTYPTRNAKVLYDKSHRIINDYIDITKYFDSGENSLAKPLVLSTTVAIASLWICDYIEDFIKAHPGCNISIRSSDQSPNLVKDNIDLYIGPKLTDEQQLLNQHIIDTYAMRLYASKEYIERHGSPKSVDDLHNHRIIAFTSDSDKPYSNINWHLSLTTPPLHPFFNINSGGGVLRAVDLGFGIGVVSNIGARVAQNELVNILPDIKGYNVPISFAYPKFLEDDIRILKMLKFIKNSIANKFAP